MPERIPLYYTFGNHQHWVDLQWLWGYHVLHGAIFDMLKLCEEAGVKGCVNFDGIGYEKLCAESPEAFAALKKAVEEGTFEIVGGSYGQPYGLFHGGESNVRQRIFGQRAATRLFGKPVKTFWEEEFDFFPQLPQMLRGVGIEYGSLFFQWTWHTPEVPREETPIVWWEAPDGSRILTATRNKLNLHQWPEDMELTFASLAEDTAQTPNTEHPTPLILQWLELMPTPDWMCRSELILPKLKELMADSRFEIRGVTLGDYLARSSTLAPRSFPVRSYGMHQVWHGMTLGKNGDNMRRLSREGEAWLLSAETLAAVAGLYGRPYASWDVYPTWELEEAWRELLSAQHHDNDECEGLCGYVGRFSYERSLKLSKHIVGKNLKTLATHVVGEDARVTLAGPIRKAMDGYIDDSEETGSDVLVFNPLGWPRVAWVPSSMSTGASLIKVDVPAFGWAVAEVGPSEKSSSFTHPASDRLERNGFRVDADLEKGVVAQMVSAEFPEGVFEAGALRFATADGEPSKCEPYRSEVPRSFGWRDSSRGLNLGVQGRLDPVRHALSVSIAGQVERPSGGLNSSIQMEFPLSFEPRIVADTAYSVTEIRPTSKGLKKYPTGDWMTSPQWFEEVHNAFTSLTLVDLVDANNPDRGLLICHDGSQQWFLDEGANKVRVILTCYDPWDEDYFQNFVHAQFLLLPHGPMKHSQRWRIAQEFLRPVHRVYFAESPSTVSRREATGRDGVRAETEEGGRGVELHPFSSVSCDADNVVLTAFYRETRDSARGQAQHAADALGVDYPYVLRLVEFDGMEADVTLTFDATVAGAVRTNLLGQPLERLQTRGSKLQTRLRPYEIATLYLDLVEGRKQVRDLDAKREIWATIHRVDD